jgi:hypothetical protein
MTTIVPSHDLVVVREAEAEMLGGGPVTGRLYAEPGLAAEPGVPPLT